jgi:hypothetical protein
MKKNILFVLLVISFVLITPAQLLAQPQSDHVQTAPDIPILGPDGVLEKIVDFLFTACLLVAAIFIVVAASLFITSQGEPEKFQKAKMSILYALIGVLVAFSARGLVTLMNQVATGNVSQTTSTGCDSYCQINGAANAQCANSCGSGISPGNLDCPSPKTCCCQP